MSYGKIQKALETNNQVIEAAMDIIYELREELHKARTLKRPREKYVEFSDGPISSPPKKSKKTHRLFDESTDDEYEPVSSTTSGDEVEPELEPEYDELEEDYHQSHSAYDLTQPLKINDDEDDVIDVTPPQCQRPQPPQRQPRSRRTLTLKKPKLISFKKVFEGVLGKDWDAYLKRNQPRKLDKIINALEQCHFTQYASFDEDVVPEGMLFETDRQVFEDVIRKYSKK